MRARAFVEEFFVLWYSLGAPRCVWAAVAAGTAQKNQTNPKAAGFLAFLHGAAPNEPGSAVTEPVEVVVHDRAQAEAVLAVAAELGREVWLRSAPDAAAYAGVGYLKALGELVGHEIVVDCGDDAGLVMAALRTGCRRLAFSGPAALSERLADMAAQLDAWYRHEEHAPEALVLSPDDDARSRCRRWLNSQDQPQ